MRVNASRLRADLESLSSIGQRAAGGGLDRVAMSPAHLQATAWLKQRMADCGLTVSEDGALNVSGLLAGRASGPHVATGSHLDSVPGGGHLDGALGVVGGLECLRRLSELGVTLARPVELIAFNDEEGRFGGMFGSQAISGSLTAEMIGQAIDRTGVSLSEQFAHLGKDALAALSAIRTRRDLYAFVELHIEQGPVLDASRTPIGVVDSIVGLCRLRVVLTGQANHAGTTPMSQRKDALQGFALIAGQIESLVLGRRNPYSRITIGQLKLKPGAANVIPGWVEFSLDVRATTRQELDALVEACGGIVEEAVSQRGLSAETEMISRLEPVSCHPQIADIVERQAKSAGLSSQRLPSGAAHDTQMMARLCPVGMLFVPSREGKSHSPSEFTPFGDIEAGTNILLNTLYELSTTKSLFL